MQVRKKLGNIYFNSFLEPQTTQKTVIPPLLQVMAPVRSEATYAPTSGAVEAKPALDRKNGLLLLPTLVPNFVDRRKNDDAFNKPTQSHVLDSCVAVVNYKLMAPHEAANTYQCHTRNCYSWTIIQRNVNTFTVSCSTNRQKPMWNDVDQLQTRSMIQPTGTRFVDGEKERVHVCVCERERETSTVRSSPSETKNSGTRQKPMDREKVFIEVRVEWIIIHCGREH